MKKIFKAIKRAFPASEATIDEYFKCFKSELGRISTLREEELSALRARVEAGEAAISSVEMRLARLEETVGKTGKDLYGVLGALKQLNDEMDTDIRQADERLREVSDDVHDIRQGDLFRRIEFLQSKLLFLESMLQRNLMSKKDQEESTLYAFMQRMRKLFSRRGVVGISLTRVGRAHDGGYVMADDFRDKRIAYSIGIADDVSWDADMAARGFDVYMYDHTIEALPEERAGFHFQCTGLGSDMDAGDPALKTLPELLKENGHSEERGMILKIDIEGAEWAVLRDLEEDILRQFSQIVFEFHDLVRPEKEEIIVQAMEKLNRTHQLVHLHANNYGTYLQVGGMVLPELLEGTYLLREEYRFEECGERVPSPLDAPNCVYLPDIFLGVWDP